VYWLVTELLGRGADEERTIHGPAGVTASTAATVSAPSAVTVNIWRLTHHDRGLSPLSPLSFCFTALG
jgi:hypothetical protein